MSESHKILWNREEIVVWPHAVPFSAIVKRVSGKDQEKFDYWIVVTELEFNSDTLQQNSWVLKLCYVLC